MSDISATVSNPTPTITAEVGSVAIAATVENPAPGISVVVNVGGSELNETDRAKLDSVEYGAQRNRDIVHELWAQRGLDETEDITVDSATLVDIAHGRIDRGTWNAGGKVVVDLTGTFLGVAGAQLQFRLTLNGTQIADTETASGAIDASTIFRFEFLWTQGRLDDSGTFEGVQRQQWLVKRYFDLDGTTIPTVEYGAGQSDIDFVSTTDHGSHDLLLQMAISSGTGTATVSGSTAYQYGYREVLWGPAMDVRNIP